MQCSAVQCRAFPQGWRVRAEGQTDSDALYGIVPKYYKRYPWDFTDPQLATLA
jgi:hypothetical protein